MNAYVKMLLMGAAIAGLYAPSAAFAQKSAGGVTGEARLHPGTGNSQGSSRSAMAWWRVKPSFRSMTSVGVWRGTRRAVRRSTTTRCFKSSRKALEAASNGRPIYSRTKWRAPFKRCKSKRWPS